jgi:hypothetical protein
MKVITYLMKVILETRRVHQIWYLRFYFYCSPFDFYKSPEFFFLKTNI